ncbi:hypothetical protein BGW38_001960 [Lunasporangiospora selenospora]|uniref:Uncharacterized protein n=1 Tax=Lunasporangiospora selenospora TaxID=979761 RepID=A0A9P6G175_9FUNG|nr:hypothetical protein BGW38_001960 [Lunasporangiospora selenospora]
MSNLSGLSLQLPLECIHLILQNLAEERDLSTLASMLLVNRTVFDATVSVLYRDPFRFFSFKNILRTGEATSLATLLRLLRPPKDEPPSNCLLEAESVGDPQTNSEEVSEQASPSTPLLRDYRSYLRHINIEDHLALLLASSPSENPFGNLDSWDYCQMDIQRDLIRELVELVAEQILSLTIPLCDSVWYLNQVQRFKSLRHVDFVEFKYDDLSNASIIAHEDSIKSSPYVNTYQLSHEPSNEMDPFIMEHIKFFPGVMRSVECFLKRVDEYTRRECPDLDLVEVARYFMPLSNPRYLDEFSMFHLLAHTDDTNLEHIESITAVSYLDSDSNEELIELYKKVGRLLMDCRQLRTMDWFSPPPSLFLWVTQQSNIMARQLWRKGDPIPSDTKQHTAPLNYIKLYHVDLHSGYGYCGLIDNLLFSFHKTLQELEVSFGKNEKVDVIPINDIKPAIFIGGESIPRLQRLQQLSIYTNDLVCVWLQPSVLNGSPLTSIIIRNPATWDLNESIHSTKASWIKPIQLTELKTLELAGPPSMTFHLDTFESTKQLETVKLVNGLWETSRLHDSDKIPETESMHLHMLASVPWNWHLPHLKELTLSDAFADHFKFKMLDGCPSLLVLTIWTGQRRILTVSDLERSGAYSKEALYSINVADVVDDQAESLPDEEAVSEKCKYIQAPRLVSLTLGGYWTISTQAWRVLLKEVAPNLSELSASGSQGYDLVEWYKLTTEMSRLQLAVPRCRNAPRNRVAFLTHSSLPIPKAELIQYNFDKGPNFLKRQVPFSE